MKVLWLSLCALAIGATHADFVVAPNDRASQAGNTFTLGGFATSGSHQHVYGARNFAGPVLIHGIAFRADEGSGSSYDVVIPRVRIRTSTYSGTFAAFNTSSYDGNKGNDDTTVFDAAVHWTGTDLPGGAPNPFNLSLAFTEPFVYDPSKGSLLISYDAFGPFSGGVVVDSHGHGDNTIGWFGGKEFANLVMQFDVTPIPEPATLLLIGVGVTAILRKEIQL